MFATAKNRWLRFAASALLVVSLWLTMSPVAYSQNVDNGPLSDQEKARLINVLNNSFARQPAPTPGITIPVTPSRTRVLYMEANPDSKTAAPSGRRIAKATVFDYTAGKAKSLQVDVATGQVLSEETIPGRPAASEEELQQAIQAIQAVPELQSLLASYRLVGGFVVDPPLGAPRYNRYTQWRLGDRRVIIFDHSTGQIAQSTIPDSASQQ